MARFVDGKLVLDDQAATDACPEDPQDALQCDSCQ